MKKLIFICFLGLGSLQNETKAQSYKAANSDNMTDDAPTREQRIVVTSAKSVVINVETRRIVAIDSLEFLLWDHYLTERDQPLPRKDHLALTSGNMYDGSRETARGLWNSPPLKDYARLSMRFGRFTYFDRFLVTPGDSLRVRIDFENARMLFSGPSADKFKIQYELAIAFENYRYDQNPIMYTAKEDYWGYSRNDSLLIQSLIDENSSIKRRMEFITSGSTGLAYLKKYFAKDWKDHPGFEIIDKYRDKLDSTFLDILYADLAGSLLYDRVNKFSTLYNEDEAHQQFFEEKIVSQPDIVPRSASYSSHYPEYLYQKLAIVSALTKEPFRNLLGDLPQDIHDQVYAQFIIKNYRRFKDSNRQFELALEQIESPWIREILERLYKTHRKGAEVGAFNLTDQKGDTVRLSDFKGKVALLDFWFTGCGACKILYQESLVKVKEHFKDRDDFVMVSISIDRDPERWHNSINGGEYTSPESVNLTTSGSQHELLRVYNIHAYPHVMLLDREGRIYRASVLPGSPEELIKILEEALDGGEASK